MIDISQCKLLFYGYLPITTALLNIIFFSSIYSDNLHNFRNFHNNFQKFDKVNISINPYLLTYPHCNFNTSLSRSVTISLLIHEICSLQLHFLYFFLSLLTLNYYISIAF